MKLLLVRSPLYLKVINKGGNGFVLLNKGTVAIGTTALEFTQFTAPGQVDLVMVLLRVVTLLMLLVMQAESLQTQMILILQQYLTQEVILLVVRFHSFRD